MCDDRNTDLTSLQSKAAKASTDAVNAINMSGQAQIAVNAANAAILEASNAASAAGIAANTANTTATNALNAATDAKNKIQIVEASLETPYEAVKRTIEANSPQTEAYTGNCPIVNFTCTQLSNSSCDVTFRIENTSTAPVCIRGLLWLVAEETDVCDPDYQYD